MSNRPAHHIMNDNELEALAKEQKQTRLYSKDLDSGERIEGIVGLLSRELSNFPKKISLRDTAAVKSIAIKYVDACAAAGAIPSKIGLCRAMGISRNAVDNFMQRNPECETSEFLEIVFDSFSEALNNAALSGSCQPVVSIFISKALYGWRDAVSVEVNSQKADPLGPLVDADELAKKYAEWVVIDE